MFLFCSVLQLICHLKITMWSTRLGVCIMVKCALSRPPLYFSRDLIVSWNEISNECKNVNS